MLLRFTQPKKSVPQKFQLTAYTFLIKVFKSFYEKSPPKKVTVKSVSLKK